MITGRIAAVAIVFGLFAAACSSGTTASSPAAGSTSDTVSVQQVPGVGDVYTDANGMALYTPTQEASGNISCVGPCTSVWIPLAAPTNGSATEAPGVHGNVGVTTRPDGSSQVTLNGAPLYRFYQDAAGTANGDGNVHGERELQRQQQWLRQQQRIRLRLEPLIRPRTDPAPIAVSLGVAVRTSCGRTANALLASSAAQPARRSRFRSSSAFRATTIVEALIAIAPTAGGNVMPAHANAPAASGIATTL
jgi:predicted lipoprotein with Yx(FWY)xxD motif